jgi:hypothetical protein
MNRPERFGREKSRGVRLGGRSHGLERACLGIDPEGGDRRPAALTDIKHLAVAADRHDGRAAGRRHLALPGELACIVNREDRDLVRILQPDVEHTRHCTSP